MTSFHKDAKETTLFSILATLRVVTLASLRLVDIKNTIFIKHFAGFTFSVKPDKMSKAASPKKTTTKKATPTYQVMVQESIKALQERVSRRKHFRRRIHNFISANYEVGSEPEKKPAVKKPAANKTTKK